VLELSWRADRLFKGGAAGTRTAPLLDAPLGELLSALSSRRPRYQPGVELPREDWGTPSAASIEPRRFLGSLDLTRAAAALELCEGLAGLARELGLAPTQADGDSPRLSALYLTALANQRLGRPFRPDPILARELPTALAALEPLDDPRLGAGGEAGALLQALARQRVEELAGTLERAMATPELATAILLRR
jgi:hypothetical protein